jgi:hypothetical protein
MMMSHESNTRFEEGLSEELDACFDSFRIREKVKHRLYDILAADYAEFVFYNGTEAAIMRVLEDRL